MNVRNSMRAVVAAAALAITSLAMTAEAGAVTLNDIISRGTVRIGVLTGAPPMGMVDEKGNPTGYDVDVANLIAGYLSLPVELVPTDAAGPHSGAPDRQGRFPCCDAGPDRVSEPRP